MKETMKEKETKDVRVIPVTGVSTDDIRRMKAGETVTFQLPSPRGLETAYSTIHRVSRAERRKYKRTTDYEHYRLTVTRIS